MTPSDDAPDEFADIVQSLRIEASPEIVWSYWVDPRRMCEWWAKAAVLDATPGGACRIEMVEGPVMVGEFVELDPFNRLVFTFGWEGNPEGTALAPGSTTVEVELTPDAGATVLTLRHTNMPATHATDHGAGWTKYLAVLGDAARRAAA